jgi:hypothetical protein
VLFRSEDIEVLTQFLDHAYGGKDYVPQGTYKQLVDSLKQISTPSSEELHSHLVRIFERVPDNHLKAQTWGMQNTATRAKSSIGENIATGQSQSWHTRSTVQNRKTISVIGISRFDLSNDPSWKGFLEKVTEIKDSSDVIILDFRGNTGGDDTMGFRMGEILMGGEAPYPVVKQVTRRSPHAWLIWSNMFSLYARSLREEGKLVPEAVHEHRSKALDSYSRALSDTSWSDEVKDYSYSGSWKYPNPKMFQGPIYILTDKRCGSSCESSIDVFDPMPSVKRVGQSTAGTLHFGNIGKLLLPHSRVIVQIPTHANIFRDNRFTEKVGFAPHINVKDGEDALTKLLSLIEQEN